MRGDECDVAVGSRFAEAEGYSADRYLPSPSRRFGIGLLQKAMHVRLGSPFRDPTSGMAVVNRKAMPIMAQPYTSGAPEVEALLRLRQAGLRVQEVAVNMRARSHGESKLQGSKAVKLVLTVIGTLVFFGWWRRRPLVRPRRSSCSATPTAAEESSTRSAPRGSTAPPRSRRPDDVVVLSGWARVRGTQSEAELMRAAWRGAAGELVVDPDARTTVGNMANAVNDILRVGAREVVVVTSSWHAPRAKAALRWLLRYTGVKVRAETTPRRSRRRVRRELLVWPLLPVPALGGGSEDLAGVGRRRTAVTTTQDSRCRTEGRRVVSDFSRTPALDYDTSTWIRCFASRSGPPERWARTARISERIESAVSSCVSAPMSSPQGPTIRVSCSSGTPASSSRSRRRSWLRREPSAPM